MQSYVEDYTGILQANQYPKEMSVNVAFVLFWITITLQNKICKIGLVNRMALWWAVGFRYDPKATSV